MKKKRQTLSQYIRRKENLRISKFNQNETVSSFMVDRQTVDFLESKKRTVGVLLSHFFSEVKNATNTDDNYSKLSKTINCFSENIIDELDKVYEFIKIKTNKSCDRCDQQKEGRSQVSISQRLEEQELPQSYLNVLKDLQTQNHLKNKRVSKSIKYIDRKQSGSKSYHMLQDRIIFQQNTHIDFTRRNPEEDWIENSLFQTFNKKKP